METTPETFSYMFLGYAVFWGLLLVYLVTLGVRLRKLEAKSEGTAPRER